MNDSGGGSPRDDDVGADDGPPDDPAESPSDSPSDGPSEPPDGVPSDPPGSPPPDQSASPPSDSSASAPSDRPDGPTPGDAEARRPSAERPPPAPDRADRVSDRTAPDPRQRPLRWYLQTERPLVVASRDVLSSVLLVTVVGLALFAVSGVWPPLVAVESGSMEPNMEQGDLVLVVEEDRFTSQLADEHGIVTRASAQDADHSQFGQPGSVIVFRPDGDSGTPIIHRAAFSVDQGENWVARADAAHLGSVDECSDVPRRCPAPHDGYITRGDANQNYDQIDGQSNVVKPEWIRGRAVSRTPYLGCIRLALSEGGTCGS